MMMTHFGVTLQFRESASNDTKADKVLLCTLLKYEGPEEYIYRALHTYLPKYKCATLREKIYSKIVHMFIYFHTWNSRRVSGDL